MSLKLSGTDLSEDTNHCFSELIEKCAIISYEQDSLLGHCAM
jgi:hypothetical protein